MTTNVETDHPHGVAHVALFTCQHPPSSGLAVGQDPAYLPNPTGHDSIPDWRYGA